MLIDFPIGIDIDASVYFSRGLGGLVGWFVIALQGSYARRKLELGIEREFREYLEGECWRERLQQTASGADLPMNACQRIKDLWG